MRPTADGLDSAEVLPGVQASSELAREDNQTEGVTMTLCEHGCGTELENDDGRLCEKFASGCTHTDARCRDALRAQLARAERFRAALERIANGDTGPGAHKIARTALAQDAPGAEPRCPECALNDLGSCDRDAPDAGKEQGK